MSERLNKTSICSIVFLDIIEYTQKPVSEQIACKDRFNRLISNAIKDVAQNDRILVDSGDGAAITLLGAPEEALFIALTIRDEILGSNREPSVAPLNVRIGINLGPVRVVKDINDQLNIIGDGINVAQRVMSFAEANQILVSRSYYEIVSRLSSEISQMFVYSGIKHDKHVREHEVYEIRPFIELASMHGGDGDHAAKPPPRHSVLLARKAAIGAGIAAAVLIAGAVAISMVKPKPPAEETKAILSSVPVHTQTDLTKTPSQPHKPKLAHNGASKDAGVAPNRRDDTASPAKSGRAELGQGKRLKKSSPTCSDAQRSLHQCG